MTTEDVEKSLNDTRLYKYLKLPNGLRVLLIRDPEMTMTQDAPGGGKPSSNESDASEDSSDEVAPFRRIGKVPCLQIT